MNKIFKLVSEIYIEHVLKSFSLEQRKKYCEEIYRGKISAIKPISKIMPLDDSQAEVYCLALGRIGSVECVQYLVARAKNASLKLKNTICNSLILIDHPIALSEANKISSQLNIESKKNKQFISLSAEANKTLMELLKNQNDSIRLYAHKILYTYVEKRHISNLLKQIKTEKSEDIIKIIEEILTKFSKNERKYILHNFISPNSKIFRKHNNKKKNRKKFNNELQIIVRKIPKFFIYQIPTISLFWRDFIYKSLDGLWQPSGNQESILWILASNGAWIPKIKICFDRNVFNQLTQNRSQADIIKIIKVIEKIGWTRNDASILKILKNSENTLIKTMAIKGLIYLDLKEGYAEALTFLKEDHEPQFAQELLSMCNIKHYLIKENLKILLNSNCKYVQKYVLRRCDEMFDTEIEKILINFITKYQDKEILNEALTVLNSNHAYSLENFRELLKSSDIIVNKWVLDNSSNLVEEEQKILLSKLIKNENEKIQILAARQIIEKVQWLNNMDSLSKVFKKLSKNQNFIDELEYIFKDADLTALEYARYLINVTREYELKIVAGVIIGLFGNEEDHKYLISTFRNGNQKNRWFYIVFWGCLSTRKENRSVILSSLYKHQSLRDRSVIILNNSIEILVKIYRNLDDAPKKNLLFLIQNLSHSLFLEFISFLRNWFESNLDDSFRPVISNDFYVKKVTILEEEFKYNLLRQASYCYPTIFNEFKRKINNISKEKEKFRKGKLFGGLVDNKTIQIIPSNCFPIKLNFVANIVDLTASQKTSIGKAFCDVVSEVIGAGGSFSPNNSAKQNLVAFG
ncbi:MAG: hypothetical protein GF353_24700 [Candidatus Lokiarchaeota archaeon]|nr:hypothetical protein [Candidatus Lokiarchaeota archaeon]